ncbi:MAG: peptidoglycan-binding protein [Oscillospiraceae bacterium]|nr:peptidoglycan-binding protein [Oscillospiraceae bacterium]
MIPGFQEKSTCPRICRISCSSGSFGSATENTVTYLQSGHSLSPDGVIGSDTWAALIAT